VQLEPCIGAPLQVVVHPIARQRDPLRAHTDREDKVLVQLFRLTCSTRMRVCVP
jgi:hypothetical protein